MEFDGFDWDEGNLDKCTKHGVSIAEIEWLFTGSALMLPDHAHSVGEPRRWAIGQTGRRHIFVVYTIRTKDGRRLVRPISARYMHRKEVAHYEKENPDF
jgi:uncharacterized DUF497 family protein